jgi:hypothetical protein
MQWYHFLLVIILSNTTAFDSSDAIQTFVNNVRIRRETPLEQHDTVRFGTDLSTYRIEYPVEEQAC